LATLIIQHVLSVGAFDAIDIGLTSVGIVVAGFYFFSWGPAIRGIISSSLILKDEELDYQTIRWPYRNIFAKPIVEKMSVPWIAVRRVEWIGVEGGPVQIETDRGNITFMLRGFDGDTNEKLVNDILSHAPHLMEPKKNPASLVQNFKERFAIRLARIFSME
jgi:hypothetical protein